MWGQGLGSVISAGPFRLGIFRSVKPGRKRFEMTVQLPDRNLPASPGRQLSPSLWETGAGGEAGSGAGRWGAALAFGAARPLPAGRAGRRQRGGCSARRFSVVEAAALPVPWAASSLSAGSRRRAGSSKEPAKSLRPARRRCRSTAGTSEPRYGAAGRPSGMWFPVRLCAGSLGLVFTAGQPVPLAGAGRSENALSIRCELRSLGPQTF